MPDRSAAPFAISADPVSLRMYSGDVRGSPDRTWCHVSVGFREISHLRGNRLKVLLIVVAINSNDILHAAQYCRDKCCSVAAPELIILIIFSIK
jgi:hypothetical protein